MLNSRRREHRIPARDGQKAAVMYARKAFRGWPECAAALLIATSAGMLRPSSIISGARISPAIVPRVRFRRCRELAEHNRP